MKYRIFAPLFLFIFSLIAASYSIAEDVIEQRYATRWNVEPIARFSMARKVFINAARCRIDEGQYKDRWINGKAVGTINGKTTWRIDVSDIVPGIYKVTYDLRTPMGAEWIPGVLRVPQIARGTGIVGKKLVAPEKWPQDKFNRIECDNGVVEFSWDPENLYIRPADANSRAVEISIDALPAVPEKYLHKLKINGLTTVPWKQIFPAGPYTGQTIRYKTEGGTGVWTDLLFVGSGKEQFFGATVVSSGSGGDDQGPPSPILQAYVDLSGLDCRSAGVGWGSVERTDPGDGPSKYDWRGLLADANLYKDGMTYCNIHLWNHWADEIKEKDPERYWKLAENFVCEAAKKYAEVGIKHFSLGFNEPEMFFRTDKEDYFNENLTHLANGVRRGCPDAIIIAGKFSSGDPKLIRSFYAHGFKDNFDVMDIHPYNNDPLNGTQTGEIVASYETLADLGMPEKRLFLGEGWGPTRDLKQVVRTRWDSSVSDAEAEYTRQYYQNGYKSLVSAKADYSPDWVLGAKYFTLNDNVGGTYWKQAARPVKNDKGEVMYYLIGELRFDNPETFKAFFCNGGLIDFFGSPKGTWFYDFPPAMPEVRVMASGGPEYVLEGEWHKIDVTVVNANPRPIIGLKLGVRERTAKFDGQVSAEAVGSYTQPVLNPGDVWQASVKVRVDRGRPGKLRLGMELEYEYDGEAHMSDDIIPTQIRKQFEVSYKPSRVVLDSAKKDVPVVVSVKNNCRKGELCGTVRYNGPDYKIVPGRSTLNIGEGSESIVNMLVRPIKLDPGVREVQLIDKCETRLMVAVPVACPRVEKPLAIDGDSSDWTKDLVSAGAIRFGNTIGKSERPASDPFPEPPPAQSSALESNRNASNQGNESKAPVFGANAAVAWDDSGFYLLAMVEDATFKQEFKGMEVWRQDSIQLAFDPLDNASQTMVVLPGGEVLPEYGHDDYEMALALTPGGPEVSVIAGPKGVATGVMKDAQLAVKREGAFTVYEAKIPWSMLKGVTAKQGTQFTFDILVNNFEGNDRYTLGWANAIADGKYPGRFVPVVLK